MKITDPFHFAEVTVVLYIDGITSLGESIPFQKYILSSDESIDETWHILKNKVMSRYPLQNDTISMIGTDLDENMDQKNMNASEKQVSEFHNFDQEINDIENFVKTFQRPSSVPNLYWLNIKSINPVTNLEKAKAKVIICII